MADTIKDKRVQQTLALAAIVLAGAVLRTRELTFGFPAFFHPDEVTKIEVLQGMLKGGDLNPHYFLHPSLLLYLSLLIHKLIAHLGLPWELAQQLALSGRIVSVLAGTLSLVPLALLGSRLFSTRTGLLAAACLAFSPLHVTCSRYMKEDILLVCFMLISAHLLVRGIQEKHILSVLASGSCAGLAAASKYSGALCAVMLIISPWLKSGSLRCEVNDLATALAALIIAAATFLLCCPYTAVAFHEFLRGLLYESRHMLKGHEIPISAWSEWWTFHYRRGVVPGLTPLSAIIATIGAMIPFRSQRGAWLFVLTNVLLWYLPAEWVRAKVEPQPERYILPCLPFLALAGARLCFQFRSSTLRLLAAGAFAISPLIRSLELASELRPDTRETVAAWIDDHLPSGAHVCLDFRFYAPSINESKFNVTELRSGKSYDHFRLNDPLVRQCDYIVLSSFSFRRFQRGPLEHHHWAIGIREMLQTLTLLYEVRSRFGSYGFHNPDIKVLRRERAPKPSALP